VMSGSFGLPGRFVAITLQRSAGRCDEFGAAAFDEIAGLRNYALEDFENLAYTGFAVNKFRKGCEMQFVVFDCLGRP
jgi:hypothetical protein